MMLAATRTQSRLVVSLGVVALALLVAVSLAWAQAAPKAKSAPAKKEAAAKPAKAAQPPMPKRRDPFQSLLVRPGEGPGAGLPLPPGKRGLVIEQLVLNGVVVSPGDNIAVVTMPGRNRAYFLRTRDELYDGYVSQIMEDSVVFRARTTDAYGKTYEKEVVKQLSGSGAKR